MPCPRLASALVLVSFALQPGCAHEESFDRGLLRKGDVTVHVGAVPAGWRRVSVDGADLAFRDEAHDGSILFDVRCAHRDDDAPLSVLTEHLIMGTTDRQFDEEETVPFDGREAMHTVLRAKLDGVPMQYDIYVMKKDGCVYDIVYVAAPDRFGAGAASFEQFAKGVHAIAPAPSAVGRRAGSTESDP